MSRFLATNETPQTKGIADALTSGPEAMGVALGNYINAGADLVAGGRTNTVNIVACRTSPFTDVNGTPGAGTMGQYTTHIWNAVSDTLAPPMVLDPATNAMINPTSIMMGVYFTPIGLRVRFDFTGRDSRGVEIPFPFVDIPIHPDLTTNGTAFAPISIGLIVDANNSAKLFRKGSATAFRTDYPLNPIDQNGAMTTMAAITAATIDARNLSAGVSLADEVVDRLAVIQRSTNGGVDLFTLRGDMTNNYLRGTKFGSTRTTYGINPNVPSLAVVDPTTDKYGISIFRPTFQDANGNFLTALENEQQSGWCTAAQTTVVDGLITPGRLWYTDSGLALNVFNPTVNVTPVTSAMTFALALNTSGYTGTLVSGSLPPFLQDSDNTGLAGGTISFLLPIQNSGSSIPEPVTVKRVLFDTRLILASGSGSTKGGVNSVIPPLSCGFNFDLKIPTGVMGSPLGSAAYPAASVCFSARVVVEVFDISAPTAPYTPTPVQTVTYPILINATGATYDDSSINSPFGGIVDGIYVSGCVQPIEVAYIVGAVRVSLEIDWNANGVIPTVVDGTVPPALMWGLGGASIEFDWASCQGQGFNGYAGVLFVGCDPGQGNPPPSIRWEAAATIGLEMTPSFAAIMRRPQVVPNPLLRTALYGLLSTLPAVLKGEEAISTMTGLMPGMMAAGLMAVIDPNAAADEDAPVVEAGLQRATELATKLGGPVAGKMMGAQLAAHSAEIKKGAKMAKDMATDALGGVIGTGEAHAAVEIGSKLLGGLIGGDKKKKEEKKKKKEAEAKAAAVKAAATE